MFAFFNLFRAPLPTPASSPSDPCPICLVEYTGPPQEIMVGYIAGCEHFFHFDCIWTWLEAKGNCPLCRQKVILKEDDIKGMSLKRVLQILDTNQNKGQEARGEEKQGSPPEFQGVSVISDEFTREISAITHASDPSALNLPPSEPTPGTSYALDNQGFVPEVVCDNVSESSPESVSISVQLDSHRDNLAYEHENEEMSINSGGTGNGSTSNQNV